MSAQFDAYDMYGRSAINPDTIDAIRGMSSPARCTHCGQVYDLGTVTVTQRYVDCSVWTSPCCHRTVDDRGSGWKSLPDIERLDAPRRR
ncbi:hypothetical protein MAUB_57800 [Mycolicibacterium aubagnense]|uniref:Uncharacterized protein n=1 Tax=Mycolicibacterium aubagnense TaxID=319707 RepID=A0ABM7IM72_9MYCO|nr:hypothetical protein MAUB_57800 [Mycolicibacterium aubagnense]